MEFSLATAVIGAVFGDEGKGHMVDYFASQDPKNSIIVRHNGGAQASHTVVTPDSERHIFGHFGSGSFLKVPTYLGPHFVVNPMLFKKEYDELRKKRLTIGLKVYANEDCFVTTPYDMMLNQFAEKKRAEGKHGSCGIGFNETIERSTRNDEFCLSVKDIKNPTIFMEKMMTVAKEYLPTRIVELGIVDIFAENIQMFASETLMFNYLRDLSFFAENTSITDNSVLKKYNKVIFEGAQGLLLDQGCKYFPHVTRSKTGLPYVVEILNDVGIKEIDAVYVSRCYATKHGAGYFEYETKESPYKNVLETTNKPNEYQGEFRYGILDIIELSGAIDQDFSSANGIEVNKSLAITCLDHLDNGNVKFIFSGEEEKPINEFVSQFMDLACIEEAYVSYGPTRNDIKKIFP